MQPSSTKVVVSDAGPLISLGRLYLLALLPSLFAEVQVPRRILEECLARPQQADTVRIQAAVTSGSLRVCVAVPIEGSAGLALGERAAIGRALEIGAGLLVDDRGARDAAQASGLFVVGTLGVLNMAKRAGHLQAIAPLIEQLRASGQRLSHAAVADALAAAQEGAA